MVLRGISARGDQGHVTSQAFMIQSRYTQDLSVLVVEDDPHVRLGCLQALQLADFVAEGADSAEQALPRVAAKRVGVVVTDMRLPQADGLFVVKQCRAFDADLPVIMITGHGDVSLAAEALRSGAYDFIAKPFSPENLVEVVRRAFEKRALTLEVIALRAALALAEANLNTAPGTHDAAFRHRARDG